VSPVPVGGKERCLDELPVAVLPDDQGRDPLVHRRQVAVRSELGRRVDEQVSLVPPDRHDLVIELGRGRVPVNESGIAGHDEDRKAPDADRTEQCDQERRLVLAVPVAVAKDVAARVRLPASDSQVDLHVVNLLLHEFVEDLDLRFRVLESGRQLAGRLLDFRRRLDLLAHQLPVPAGDAVPGGGVNAMVGPDDLLGHHLDARRHVVPRRHGHLLLERGNIPHSPPVNDRAVLLLASVLG